MPLTSRLATLHPTQPTITLDVTGAVYPAIPELQGNFGCPVFFCGSYEGSSVEGWIDGRVSSNMPLVYANGSPAADSLETNETLGGVTVYGYSPSSYAIRTAGTVTAGYAGFTQGGTVDGHDAFIDGVHFGLRSSSFAADPWEEAPPPLSQSFNIELYVQPFEAFSGGTFNAPTPPTVVKRSVDVLQGVNVDGCSFSHVTPTLASVSGAGEALVWSFPTFGGPGRPQMFGFKIAADGAVTGPVALVPNEIDLTYAGVFAVCLGGGRYHAILDATDSSLSALVSVYASIGESTYGAEDYQAYRAGFNHPDLPAFLDELLLAGTGAVNGRRFIAFYGTEAGFILTYKLNVAGVWEQRYVLIARDWSVFQWLQIAPQNTVAEEIVAQSVAGITTASNVSLFHDAGTYYLLGGTTSQPKVATAGGSVIEEPGTSSSRNLRVWAYSLDGHDFYVLRVGASLTLVYDLTTGQWAEWRSPERTNWRPHVGQNWIGMQGATLNRGWGTDVVCGDDVTNTLFVLDPDLGQDEDPVSGLPAPFTRVTIGGIPLDGRETAKCGAVTLELSRGNPSLTGASITLETSDDFGKIWLSHGAVTVAGGAFSQVVEWRGLGLMRAPGRVFRLTDNGAAIRISSAVLR